MKFLLDLNSKENAAIKQGFADYDRKHESFAERKRFIEKQIEDFNEEVSEYSKGFWKGVREYVKEKGLLPEDYSDGKVHQSASG